MVARASGAVQWRRLRRLRAALRHEQQSIAMALASALHHSADKTTRAQYNAPRGQKNAGTEYYALSDEDEVPARGSRPPCLGEPRGPQERDQLRTVEQIAVYAPMVQILDAPVPQTVEQLHDVLQFFHRLSTVPEPVIEVPKIYTEDVPMRAALRATQLAEQLVEVPTTVSYVSLLLWQALHGYRQRTVEQNVDIPAVGGSGTGGGPSGFLPGQSYSVTAEQIVDNPVRPGGAGDLQGFPRGQGSTAFLEQIAEFPDPVGGQPTRFSASPGLRSVFLGSPWTSWSRGFSHFAPK